MKEAGGSPRIPHPGRRLFADANGALLRRSNFHRRVWVPIRDAAKLPKGTRFHDLRHAAAWALLQGADQGDSRSAEAEAGYRWGEETLAPHVRRILALAIENGEERVAQLARRFLRAVGKGP